MSIEDVGLYVALAVAVMVIAVILTRIVSSKHRSKSWHGSAQIHQDKRPAYYPIRDRNPEHDLRATINQLEVQVAELSAINARLLEENRALKAEVPPLVTSLAHVPTAVPAAQYEGVELNGEFIIESLSLRPTGFLRKGDDGVYQLSLNDNVDLDHVAFQRWARWFDFGDGKPYARYETHVPALVQWDSVERQGRLLRQGQAKQVP